MGTLMKATRMWFRDGRSSHRYQPQHLRPRSRSGRLFRGVGFGVVASLLVLMSFATAPPSGAASDSQGADFWLTFPGNLGAPELTLFISGGTATTGTVAIPGLAFSQNFSVTPGAVTSVSLPTNASIDTSDTVEDLGIHVTAGAEISVYGLNRVQYTTDAYLGLPTDILGTSYVVLGYENVDVVEGTEFAVVASQDGTVVTINPSVTTGTHTAGTPYTVNLDQGQTYQLRNTDASPADLSGTFVTSTKPIAVFGGHECANIPAGAYACDHIVEQLPPTETWGKSFVTEPLATRTGGDTFRVLASQAATTVKVNGATVATLNAGQLYETVLTAASTITSDKPVLVAQYSNSSSFDGVTSDPFEMMIPPYEQFLNSYTVTTPATGFDANFINLVVPNGAVGSVNLDGVAIPAGSFTAIPGSSFSGAQVPVELGAHTLNGPLPFGAFMYGFASYDSYGYPGGLSLAPVAQATKLVLAPKTASKTVGTQHCVTGTVTDQNGAGLAGIRVDFAVSGANTTAGFANTDASGVAQFCYTGNNVGSDSIVGTQGTLSDTAAATWTDGGPPPDKTPPVCALASKSATGITILTKDSGSGLASVTVNQQKNATVTTPAFTPGTTSDVISTATKIKLTESSAVQMTVTDVAGNKTVCDPITAKVAAGAARTFSGVAAADHYLTVSDASGVTAVAVETDAGNRVLWSPDGQTVDLGDLGSGTVKIRVLGAAGTSATIMLWDGKG